MEAKFMIVKGQGFLLIPVKLLPGLDWVFKISFASNLRKEIACFKKGRIITLMTVALTVAELVVYLIFY